MSNNFIATSPSNPCNFCEDTKGNCRHGDDIHLCMGLNSNRRLEIHKHHKIIGFTHDGLWAMLKLDNSEQWHEGNCFKPVRQAPKQKGKPENVLAINKRNAAYRAITAKLNLSFNHVIQLRERRGLSPQEIDFAYYLGWIRTWKRGLEVTANSKLAGIHPTNHTLLGGNGIAIAATDGSHKITGFQIASDDRENFAKYFWLSSAKHGGNSPNLPNGELPLFIWKHPQAREINEVWLVEGALKSLITALKLWLRNNRTDVMVIGAAGGNFAGSVATLKDALVGSSCKYVKLQPDAGAVSNPHITGNYRKIINSLTKDGYKCTVGWWGQSTKAFPDVDELESFSNITYLSTLEFKALCVKWGGIKDNKSNDISPTDYHERVAYEQKKLHSLTYPADYICDSSQKYLPDLIGKIPTSGIISLKSPKGSGKSTQIKKIKNHCCGYTEEIEIKPEVEPLQLSLLDKTQKQKIVPKPEIKSIRHKGLGMNFLSINARIALGRAQAVQWDFTWIEDADVESKDEFGSKVSTATAIENIGEIGCCWDSLGKFFERDWSNTLVVIDESELGFGHVSISSTCKDRRSFILKTLEVKLKECLDNGGLVIAADADFTDVSYDYLKAITGYTPYIVQHDFKGDPWEIDFYTGKRDLFLTQIENWVSDENCEPIAIALDNQAECEALANLLMKKYSYLKNKVGGLIRIDSKVTQTDFGKDFVKHTNQRIKDYLPKILLFTPSLGVGCSIDVHHFKHVFGLCYGNLEPSQSRQMLARVRESVPRSVWCKARANNSQDTPTSYLPSEIKKRLFSNQKSTTEIIELALQLAKENAEASDIDDTKLLPLLIEQLQSMMGNGGWDNPHVDLYCKQIARRNYSLNQLAVQLRQELIDEGHTIVDVAIDEATNTGDSVRHEKDEIKHQKSKATAQAEDIEVDEAMRIKNKPARTEEENHKAIKSLLKKELPGVELNKDFLYKAIYKDNRRWFNQIKLFWLATNPDVSKELDSSEWRRKLKQFSNGVNYLPDVKTYSHKVETIEKIKLLEFLNPLEEYSEDSPRIKQFIRDCQRHRKKLKYAFGINLTKNYYPIKLLNRLLERIGLKMRVSRKESQGESKIRYYRIDEDRLYDTDRIAVIESLNRKFKDEPQKSTQSQSQHKTQPGHKFDITYINNETSVPVNKPVNQVLQDVTQQLNLTSDQENALLKLLDFAKSDQQEFLLEGYAGTGKTFIIQQFLRKIVSSQSNPKICLAAPTNNAVKVLTKMASSQGLRDFIAITVHKLLKIKRKINKTTGDFDFCRDKSLREKFDYIIIDEASMLNKELYEHCQELAQSGMKIIYMGDPAQLPPVNESDSPVFSQISNSAKLTEVVRYEGDMVRVAESIRNNLNVSCPEPIQNSEDGTIQLVSKGNFENKIVELFSGKEFQQDKSSFKAIAYTNNRVDEINKIVKDKLYGKDSSEYLPGMRVIARSPLTVDSERLLDTSEEMTIRKVFKFNANNLNIWNLEGDTENGEYIQIQCVATESKAEFKKQCEEKKREIRKQLPEERDWNEFHEFKEKFADIRLAYAITVHNSQGKTIQKGIVDQENLKIRINMALKESDSENRTRGIKEYNQLRYVAMTRFQDSVVFLDDIKPNCSPFVEIDLHSSEYIDEEWYKPESITDVASMLEYCDSPQMLAELRETKIPVPVLKLAARQLPDNKRYQIREWVVGNSG